MQRHVVALQGLVALGVAALAPAVWGIAELAPNSVSADERPDYLVHPLGLSLAARTAITIGAVVFVVAASITWTRALRRLQGRRASLGVIMPLAAVTAAAGLVYSAVTEPGIGANIGGGIALMAAIPFAAAMLGLAALRGWRLWSSAPG